MADFLDQFLADPDPDMASYRRVWVTDKPILKEAVVAFAPPYPDFVRWKLRGEATTDPSCPSARDIGETVEVVTYDNGNGFESHQQVAWNYLLENAGPTEARLRDKLFAHHRKQKNEFLEDYLPDDDSIKSHWRQIESSLDWDDPKAIDVVYKLVSIGLIDRGLDDCGFVTFDFQTGWDMDHGVGVVMHKDKSLAAAGMQEFTSADVIGTIKSVQGYDLDDVDSPL